VSDCYNTGKIFGHYDAGGISGWIQNGIIMNCYNTAYVEAVWDAGGVVGAIVHSDAYVKNCYNTGNIKVFREVQNNYVAPGAAYSYKYAGGISGFIWGGHIDNCYNSGDIYSIEQGGGIFGGDYFEAGGSVSNCRTVGESEGLSYIGKVYGWSGGVKTSNNSYYEKTDDNYNTIVSLLNAQVTSENSYKGWKRTGDNIVFSTAYDVEFNVIPADAKIIVKDSEENQMTEEDGVFSLVNGTYTYEVSADGYTTKKSSFEVNDSAKSIKVTLLKNEQALSGEDTSWYDAEKTEFTLSTANEFAGLLKLVNEGNDFEGKTINLSKSISLENSKWASIGSEAKQFNGKFDGNGSVISNLDADLFGYIGEKGSVQNIGIEGTGAIATVNKGTIANSYALTSSNIAKTNNGTVTNTYTNGNTVVGEGTDAVDSYAIDGEAYTEEDLANSKIADLLNKNVKATNSTYQAWTVKDGNTTFNSLYKASFELSGNGSEIKNEVIKVYDKNKNEITTESTGAYKNADNTYSLVNGTYTYTVSADRYEEKSGILKIKNGNVTEAVSLETLYTATFKTNVENTTIKVYNSDKKEISQNEDGTFYLSNGEYTYEVSKDGYWTEAGSFTVNSADLSIDVNLAVTYNVSFSGIPDGVTAKITIKDKDENVIAANSEGTYDLKAGEYTYVVTATKYIDIESTITVQDKDIVIPLNFELSYDISWYDASKDSFEIKNGAQLAGLAALTNGEEGAAVNFSGKTITIVDDIQLTKAQNDWLPIADNSNTFKGTLDGKNHIISDINITECEKYASLIGDLNRGIVKNIITEGSINVEQTGKIVAGIVANSSNATIENCINRVSIEYITGSGGVVKYANNNTIIKNCINEADLSGGQIGGIVQYPTSSTILNCKNTGNIYATSKNSGGIVGPAVTSTINYCINEGNVEAANGVMHIGGIVGSNSRSTTLNSYNTGKISGGSKDSPVYIGGIAGYNEVMGGDTDAIVANCYNLGEVTSEGQYVGGIVGSYYRWGNGKCKLFNCYNYGTVTGNEAGKYVGAIIGNGHLSSTTDAREVRDCYYLEGSC
ncbi:MAG: hypothetical protein ACI3VR_03190, partial [Intestinibacter sp.]|uniref:hypothetical protein n=1 Tax=Intestinibacter sp. TaxID=1965304 RepID=UPI003F185FF7